MRENEMVDFHDHEMVDCVREMMMMIREMVNEMKYPNIKKREMRW